MGAWGTGIFQNDNASDWIWDFEKKAAGAKLPFLLREIRRGLKDEIPASETVAACEGIAWSRGHGRHDSFDRSYSKFAASVAPAATDAQAELARKYVAFAIENAAAMGWVNASAEKQWLAVLRDLDLRLAIPSARKKRPLPARKKVSRTPKRR